jgi:hypothetical protein
MQQQMSQSGQPAKPESASQLPQSQPSVRYSEHFFLVQDYWAGVLPKEHRTPGLPLAIQAIFAVEAKVVSKNSA